MNRVIRPHFDCGAAPADAVGPLGGEFDIDLHP
jgi:hypothetical protein